jgi:hypothetical protein
MEAKFGKKRILRALLLLAERLTFATADLVISANETFGSSPSLGVASGQQRLLLCTRFPTSGSLDPFNQRYLNRAMQILGMAGRW